MSVIGWLRSKAQGAVVPLGRDGKDDPAKDFRYRVMRWGTILPFRSIFEAENAVYQAPIYRCMDKIATAVAGVDWYIEKEGDEPKPGKRAYTDKTTKHLQTLLDHPHDYLSSFQLRYWMALALAAYGNSFMKIGCDRLSGLPNAIYPLITPKVTHRTDKHGALIGWEYSTSVGEFIKVPTKLIANGKEAWGAHIFKVALDYVNKTYAPMESLGFAPQVAHALMQRAYEMAMGAPNMRYIISADRELGEEQRDQLQEDIAARRTGEPEAGNVLFVHGANVKVEEVGAELGDLHTKIPLDDMQRYIAGVFGVPIPLLGLSAADGAKYASNYAEARISFYQDTIIPGYLSLIEGGLTEALCPPGYRVRFDHDTIGAVKDAQVNRALSLSPVTFLTPNEKRALCGFGQIAGGDKLQEPAPGPKPKPQDSGAPSGQE